MEENETNKDYLELLQRAIYEGNVTKFYYKFFNRLTIDTEYIGTDKGGNDLFYVPELDNFIQITL